MTAAPRSAARAPDPLAGWRRHAGRAALALLCVAGPVNAWATTPAQWKEITYAYRADSAPLEDRLQDVARAVGVRLQASGLALRQPVQMRAGPLDPASYLDRLGQVAGLQWFHHAGTLYVSPSRGSRPQRIPLATESAADARKALVDLGLFEPKFGWGEVEGDVPTAVVTGPAAYVELVRAAVGQHEAPQEQPQATMIFRLLHAQAVDVSVSLRDRNIVVPGVASTLRRLLSLPESASASPGAGGAVAELGALAALSQASAQQAVDRARRSTQPAGERSRGRPRPTVEAYSPLNAVLVRDAASKRAEYESIIASLDVAPQQIEILATIVDVDDGKLRQWDPGLDLRVGNVSLSSHIADPDDPGQSGASLVLWGMNRLQLRLQALESEGAARVQSRPSVLTLDNQPAVLDLSQSAYYPLIGERSTDLRAVTVGTLLKVTPRVLGCSGGAPDIRLEVEIEDGALKDTGRGATPQASRSSIVTQAILQPGQALVIGGHRQDSDQQREARVPVLGSLPLIGALFTRSSVSRSTRERMFVVSARVLEGVAAAGPLCGLPQGTAAPAPAPEAAVPTSATPAPAPASGAGTRIAAPTS